MLLVPITSVLYSLWISVMDTFVFESIPDDMSSDDEGAIYNVDDEIVLDVSMDHTEFDNNVDILLESSAVIKLECSDVLTVVENNWDTVSDVVKELGDAW